MRPAPRLITTINIPHESVWGWDYLEGLCKTLGLESHRLRNLSRRRRWRREHHVPRSLVPIRRRLASSAANPARIFTIQGAGLVYALPPFYPGRNVPDVSFNADPETGYIIYYTSECHRIRHSDRSTAAPVSSRPQLNGVTALLGQYLRHRLGLLNNPLYRLALTGQAYRGPSAPLTRHRLWRQLVL